MCKQRALTSEKSPFLNEADPIPNDNFFDDYILMAPLEGDSYAIDTVQVHTFLVNFVSGNNTAEAKTQGLPRPNDGRDAFKQLVEHYEGVSIHAKDIREADKVIKNLFCAGEKPPHMWWSEFEKHLTRAFNAQVKRERSHRPFRFNEDSYAPR